MTVDIFKFLISEEVVLFGMLHPEPKTKQNKKTIFKYFKEIIFKSHKLAFKLAV